MTKQLFCTLAIVALALGACRKQTAGDYEVRITVDDANTSRIWGDTVGKTKNGGWYIELLDNSNGNSSYLGGAVGISNTTGTCELSLDDIRNQDVSKCYTNGSVTFYPSTLSEYGVIDSLASITESKP